MKHLSIRLSRAKVRAKGKIYTYWTLRWCGCDGAWRGKRIGRADGETRLLREDAEKLRFEKEKEIDAIEHQKGPKPKVYNSTLMEDFQGTLATHYELHDRDCSGYFYLIESMNKFKIGISTRWKERLQTYKTENPHGIKVIFCCKCVGYKIIEAAIKSHFWKNKISGPSREWFVFADIEIKEIYDFLDELGVNWINKESEV